MVLGLNLDIPPPTAALDDESARRARDRFLRKIELEPEDWIGLDTETHAKKIDGAKSGSGKAPLDWMHDTITFWSMCTKFDGQVERYCFDQTHLHYMIPVLENPRAQFAGYNTKYDAHVLWNSGINIWNCKRIPDFQIAATMLNENMQGRVGLKIVTQNGFDSEWRTALDRKIRHERGYTDFDRIPRSIQDDINEEIERRIEPWRGFNMTGFKELFAGCIDPKTGKQAKEFETSLYDLPSDRVINYASLDAYGHYMMALHLISVMTDHTSGDYSAYENMWEYFQDVEVPITEILWRMERRGLPLDKDKLGEMIEPLQEELDGISKEINRIAGEYVNLNSTPQVARLLYGEIPENCYEDREWRAKVVKWTKGGAKGKQPSTDDESLGLMTMEGDEEQKEKAKLIQRYRKVDKIRGTYVKKLHFCADFFEDGRVHTGFKQYGARTGRFSTADPLNCFDGKTEILTREGWVQFKDYDGQDVAQWHENGDVEFVKPLNVYKYDVPGMVNLHESQQINLCVTDCHDCLVQRDSGRLVIVKGKDYADQWGYQIQAGRYVGGEGIPGVGIDEVRWLVAMQADGSWHEKGAIDFGFAKDRKAKRLIEILESLGADYNYKKYENRHRFYIPDKDLIELTKKVMPEKKLGSWILDLTEEQLEALSEELFHWDGCFDRMSMYASSEKENTDWAQIAVVLTNRRAKVRRYVPTNPNARPSWQLDCSSRNRSMIRSRGKFGVQTKRIHVDATYCVEVPTHHIVVRREGKVAITNQSQNLPNPETDEFGIRTVFTSESSKEINGTAVEIGTYQPINRKHRRTLKSKKYKRKMIVVDYGQLEMRIMAHFSEDEGMLEAIRSGLDMHCVTVEKMFGVPYDEVISAKKAKDAGTATPEQKEIALLRKKAKTVGFGIIYGAGATTIGMQLEVPKEEAQDLINKYFEAFPGVKTFMSSTIWRCKELKFVTTLLGRRRNLPEINNNVFMTRSHAEREANNSVIQGSAADLVKAAMIAIEKDDKLNAMGVEMVNQIHDELVLLGPLNEEDEDEALNIVADYMMYPFEEGKDPLLVPTPVDARVVLTWAEAK